MNNSICGIDCTKCELKNTCGGCAKTNGRPFKGECVVAACCLNNQHKCCSECTAASCGLKEKLIEEFNLLGISDMAKVTSLNSLKGSYINVEYTLPDGKRIKLLDDNKIYLGNMIEKAGSNRCYGITADENYLLVSEFGTDGKNAEIIIYKKR